jgi:hypothetical protein
MHDARMVTKDNNVVIVAIPEDTDTWPHHYKQQAFDKIKEAYPAFDPKKDNVSFQTVPVGPQSRHNYKTEVQVICQLKPAIANGNPMNGSIVPVSGTQPNIQGQQPPANNPVGGPAMGLNASPGNYGGRTSQFDPNSVRPSTDPTLGGGMPGMQTGTPSSLPPTGYVR